MDDAYVKYLDRKKSTLEMLTWYLALLKIHWEASWINSSKRTSLQPFNTPRQQQRTTCSFQIPLLETSTPVLGGGDQVDFPNYLTTSYYKVRGKLKKPEKDSPHPVKKICLLEKLKNSGVNHCTTMPLANLFTRRGCAKKRIRVYLYF